MALFVVLSDCDGVGGCMFSCYDAVYAEKRVDRQ